MTPGATHVPPNPKQLTLARLSPSVGQGVFAIGTCRRASSVEDLIVGTTAFPHLDFPVVKLDSRVPGQVEVEVLWYHSVLNSQDAFD